MNKKVNTLKIHFKVFLLPLFIYIFTSPVNAVMPDARFRQAMVDSKIKAIATITKIETTFIDKYHPIKKATFKLEYEFIERSSKAVTKTYNILRKLAGNETPQIFTGSCPSYYRGEEDKNIINCVSFSGAYAKEGERVIVTVSKDGGSIASLQDMTPELEKAIRKTPEKLEFDWIGVYIMRD